MIKKTLNTHSTLSTLKVGNTDYKYFDITKIKNSNKLPFTLRILLENLLRNEDGISVKAKDIEALSQWEAKATPSKEIAFTAARVLMQDFTGVPAIVDLAAMRDAMKVMGGDPNKINPLVPVELVIDHSVQVDHYGTKDAADLNAKIEFDRNGERYAFLKWGQQAFNNFKVVPPDTGIVHQVNLEYLARVVMTDSGTDGKYAYPDTLVGTDSHTTMINGLGVLGWGVGGIEAEAGMLGQPSTMLIPQVVGFKLLGKPREGITATDVVLTVTQMLRKKGVVGKFVEFFGPGAKALSLADRATVANMAPEYGATCGFFPVDDETLKFLKLSGRNDEQIALVEQYCKAQGLFWTEKSVDAEYSDTLELDLATVEASLAGPSRPQDRVTLKDVARSFLDKKDSLRAKGVTAQAHGKQIAAGKNAEDGDVVIAAITSCTNTSNPSVMIAAGIVAKKAVELGLNSKEWVKTSLAPGSQVVKDYLEAAGLLTYLEQIKFHIVGYGCTTCIGNSGPLNSELVGAYKDAGLVSASVLSGNRNFEGRVHPDVRANYLASPPLVVAYALAGRIGINWDTEPIGKSNAGNDVFLKDIWPTNSEIEMLIQKSIKSDTFKKRYGDVYLGDKNWQSISVRTGATYEWDPKSTYVRLAPYFNNFSLTPTPPKSIKDARVLAVFGDSITTDHISPAGNIKANGPAGGYLQNNGVEAVDFNSYGARRGNHEVMVRGTFANVRIKNLMTKVEGGMTRLLPDNKEMSIYDASIEYQKKNIPLVVIAGKEYGSGSSRDWAAKGPYLLGIKAVIAESYERIHRSNLVGMGILPLQFKDGENKDTYHLNGEEVFTIDNIDSIKPLDVIKISANGKTFEVQVRIDTPLELEYYKHGGILQYVLRQLIKN